MRPFTAKKQTIILINPELKALFYRNERKTIVRYVRKYKYHTWPIGH